VPLERRVLDLEPVADLADHLSRCGGDALAVAASTDPIDLIGAVVDAGLRGRGGAGFPTGVKWQSRVSYELSRWRFLSVGHVSWPLRVQRMLLAGCGSRP